MTDDQHISSLFGQPSPGSVDDTLGALDGLIAGNRSAHERSVRNSTIGACSAFVLFVCSFFLDQSGPLLIAAMIAVGFWVEGNVHAAHAAALETDNEIRKRLYLVAVMLRRINEEQGSAKAPKQTANSVHSDDADDGDF